ncbi:hypothetical protein VM1G_12002 [Cytospora mali]|uniref:Uncharacterized protein n=1 Tax=Cytospora mali TaxID=578113 RepID=A0A194VH40_CYTMA|nr:hypothetical protein VM1G_12002 [Valsa mali]
MYQVRKIRSGSKRPSEGPTAAFPIIIFESWDKAASSVNLPLPCLVRCSSINENHKEVIELVVTTFILDNHQFVRCSSASWPCCEKSDLATEVQTNIEQFYSDHFALGAWVNQGHVRHKPEAAPRNNHVCRAFDIQLPIAVCNPLPSTPEVDNNEADRVAVLNLIHKAISGSQQLAERGTGHLDETILAKEVVRYQARVVAQNDRQSNLEAGKRFLSDFEKQIKDLPQQTRDRLRWRVRFVSCCLDILLRVRGETGRANTYQRRKANSALMINSIVNGLFPTLGAYALVVYSILEAANFSYHFLSRRDQTRQERFVYFAVDELSRLKMHVPRDNNWFHPALILAVLTGESYSSLCEAIGLGHMALPGIRISLEAEVPWAASICSLFKERSAGSSRVVQLLGEDGHIVITPSDTSPWAVEPLPGDASTGGPNFNIGRPQNLEKRQPTGSPTAPSKRIKPQPVEAALASSIEEDEK